MIHYRGWLALIVMLFAAVFWHLFFFVHQHCIMQAAMLLRDYADRHEGRFPTSPRGFGDALLLLMKEGGIDSPVLLAAPGDNGAVYQQALFSGADVDENLCTRIYIQGLTIASPENIAVLFDRTSCPGGDHHRWYWGEAVREVAFGNGVMTTIKDIDWPVFAASQVHLLIQQGMSENEARSAYALTGVHF